MNKRLFLYSAFIFVGLLLYESWTTQFKSNETVSQQAQEIPATGVTTIPEEVDSAVPLSKSQEKNTLNFVTVNASNTKLKIDLKSGSISYVELLDYKNEFGKDSGNVVIIDDVSYNYVAPPNLQTSDDKVLEGFVSKKNEYYIEGNQRVSILHTNTSDYNVTKKYYFIDNPYLVYVDQIFRNKSNKPVKVRQFNTIQRGDDLKSNAMLYTFTGAAYYDDENKFNKIDLDDIREQNFLYETKKSWIGMLEHYFFTAWIPENNGLKEKIYTRDLSDGVSSKYLIGVVSDYITINPKSEHTFTSKLYVGPKVSEEISKIAPGLGLTDDYGVLTFISAPLFWILNKLYNFFGNWGWSIIMLTVLIKIIFYKLSETSYKSMAKMKKLSPRMTALKERYADDRKKFSEALMKVYKEEKVNPLGGCLPILIQIPVFIALYWVIIESVEMRHAPFIGWIQDLSSKDPYFVLPILMGVSMFVQQKLNPPPADPTQQKIFMFLPIIFTLLFATFPSGLVLYWFINNVLSIGQQYVINKRLSV